MTSVALSVQLRGRLIEGAGERSEAPLGRSIAGGRVFPVEDNRHGNREDWQLASRSPTGAVRRRHVVAHFTRKASFPR